MKYINFDESRKLDLVLLGRVAIDFNPAYSDDVKEEFKPLKKVHYFEKFVGGSPANIAVGVTHHGMKAGFIGKVSDDQFGEYVVDYFNEQGIDTSCISKCTNGEKLGLTFTEMLSPKESSILMYRNRIADLQLHVDDIDEEYIKSTTQEMPESHLKAALDEFMTQFIKDHPEAAAFSPEEKKALARKCIRENHVCLSIEILRHIVDNYGIELTFALDNELWFINPNVRKYENLILGQYGAMSDYVDEVIVTE